MDESVDLSLFSHFSVLPDPRKNCLHNLSEILVIAICAVLCGADGWVAIEAFGKAQRKWFRSFLTLKHGIPSHDTFGRVFAMLDTQAFAQCFLSWTQALAGSMAGKHVAVDGKSLRRSFDRAAEKAMIHMVSAWAVENALVLGQIKTEEKSNEIKAIPKLLKQLELKGCLVTADAMGCQKAIAKQIVEQGGDYLLGLKDNHPTLYADVIELFDYARTHAEDSPEENALEQDSEESTATREEREESQAVEERPPAPAVTVHSTMEKGHGRVEERTVYCISDLRLLSNKKGWKGLSSIAMVVSKRTLGEKTSQEWRYYISSCKEPEPPGQTHQLTI